MIERGGAGGLLFVGISDLLLRGFGGYLEDFICQASP